MKTVLVGASERQKLVRLAQRYTTTGAAEDAAHDGVVHALRGLKSFRGQAQLSTWLHQVVVNACLMHRRKTSRFEQRQRHEIDVYDAHSDSHTEHTWAPGRLFERQEEIGIVRRALAALPPLYREAAQLCLIDERPPGDVARDLGVSASAVRTRVQRAKKQLVKLLAATLPAEC